MTSHLLVTLYSVEQASDRLEAFINKMMQKAELLNTTREEQILKKQQILEELQKVGNLLLDSVLKSRQQAAPPGTGDDGKVNKVRNYKVKYVDNLMTGLASWYRWITGN